MADAVATTPLRGTKDVPETPTLASFPAFLQAFRSAMDAETRIDHRDIDPMTDHFAADMRHADHLRERLIERCFDVLEHVPETPGDQRLQRLAFSLKRAFELEGDEDRQRHFAFVRDHSTLFVIEHPDDPHQPAIPAMQEAFLAIFSDMGELREYGGAGREFAGCDVAAPIPA